MEKAISDTFEGIAFSQVLDCSLLNAAPDMDGTEIGVWLALPEPVSLRFSMVMRKNHAKSCFEAVAPGINIDDVSDIIIIDFVKELTNTVAGHLNTLLAPNKEDMTIGLPIELKGDEVLDEVRPTREHEVLRFQIEEYGLYCSLD